MRSGAADRASESRLTVLLVVLGGSSLLLLWVKVTALTIADRPAADATWGATGAAILIGALCGAGGYLLWGKFAPRVSERLGGPTSKSSLRVAWSFADFPLAAYLVVFLPLDLLIVGPEIFASDRLDGTGLMIWAAISVALGVSALVWMIYLAWRGIEAATGLNGRPVLGLLAFGTFCYLAVAVLLVAPLLVLRELT
jgi:hypothetical protein